MSDQLEQNGVRTALRDLTKAHATVLVIEPHPDHQSRLARLVTVHGHRVIGAASLDGATALLRALPVELVLVAEELAAGDPARMVAGLVSVRPHARVVIITAPESARSGIRPARVESLEYAARPVESATPQALTAS